LLQELEVALDRTSSAQALVQAYEKSCFTTNCNVLCEFDALKIKFYRGDGDYKSALKYGRKALSKRGDDRYRAQILLEIAIVYYVQEDIDAAVKHLHQAISIKKIDKKIEAKAFLMLGNAHVFLGNINYARRYFSKTYHVAVNIGDSSLISSALNGQGLIAYGKGERSNMIRAINLFNRSLSYLNTPESAQSINLINNIAAAYLNLKEYGKAEKYFLNCAKMHANNNSYEALVSAYNNLSAIYIETNRWSKAKIYLDKAIELYSNELLGYEMMPELNLTLSDYYYHEGNYQVSRNYYAKYANQELKRLNAEQSEAVIESQERYDDLKRTKLINDLKLSKKRAEVKNLRLQNVIYLILVAFISLSIVAYFFINTRRNRDKRERKAALSRAALQAAENEKLRVSRELHDSMGGTLTVMNLLLGVESEKQPSNSNLLLLSDTTKNAIDDLRRICRDLYPSELKIAGLVPSLQTYFEKLNHSQEVVRFVLDVPEELFLNAGFNINFYRIVQELTNNTLKYAEASEARLTISVADGKFNAFYQDNGQGIDIKHLRKGVGLNSIEERTFSFKGKVEFKSAAKEGFSAKMLFFSDQVGAASDDSNEGSAPKA
jgi:signal transduction histidine kinase